MSATVDIREVIQYIQTGGDPSIWGNDHCRAINDLIAAYNSRITTKQKEVTFIGKGVGATKTTTAIYGNMIVEEFGVGDEVYLHGGIPPDMDITSDVLIKLRFAPQAAEAAKKVSFDLVYQVRSPGDLVNATDGTLSIANVDVPVTQYEDFTLGDFTIPSSAFSSTSEDIYMKLARVASTADGSDVALHSVHMQYTSSALT